MGTNLGQAYGRIVVDGKGAVKGFEQAAKGATGFSKASKIAFAGVAAAGVGFGAAITSSVKIAASFEQQLADLRSVARPTGKEFDALREQALKLGADTKFSAQEAAAAQAELAKGGLEAADILGGALQGALALAAAGDLELADASSYAVNAMKMFGLQGKDVASVADAMATAANITTADVADFGEALSNGGALAKTAGLSFRQTMGFLTALADASVKGGEAGTTMKSAFVALLNPTKQQAKAARDLGINFQDANGDLKDAAGISAELRKATDGMTKSERARTMAQLAGTYGMRTLLALYDAGPAKLEKYERQLGKAGTAAETARIKQGTLEGQLEQLGGAIDTIKIRLGSALIPGLTAAATATADWLSVIGDSQALDDFGAGLADGLRAVTDAAVSAWAAVRPLIVDLGGGLVDAAVGVGQAFQNAAPMVLVLGQALVTTTGAVIGVVSPILSLTGALMGLPGVGQGAAVALASLGGAMMAVKLSAATGGAVAFVQLAGTIRSATDAAALGAAAFPRLAGVLATLASPAGLAGLAIGGVAAGIALLASGAFSGRDSAQVLADALSNVATQAQAANGAITGFRSAIDRMKDADVALASAKANLIAATENERRVMADSNSTAGQRAQATAAVAAAEQQLSKAQRESAQSVRNVGSAAVEGTVDLARLSVEITRGREVTDEQAAAMTRLGKTFRLSDDATRRTVQAQRVLAAQGASTADRVKALQMQFLDAASSMDTSTKAGQRTHDILTAIGNLSPEGLNRFAGRVQQLERDGVPAAKALNQALEEATADRLTQLAAADKTTPKARQVRRELAAIHDRAVRITAIDAASSVARSVADVISQLKDKTVTLTTVPVHKRGSPTVYQTIDMINALPKQTTRTVVFQPRGTGATEMAASWTRAYATIIEDRERLDSILAGIDRREEARQQRVERARLARELRSSERKLAQAKKDEKAAAQSAANQAKAALAEFDRQARLEAKKRPLTLLVEQLQLAESAFSDLESSLSDIGSRIKDALQRSFDGVVKGLDDALAGTVGYIDKHLSAMLATIDAGLTATVAGIDATLARTLAQIEASTDAARVKAITAATEAARLSRQARDDARKLAELQEASGAAGSKVDRLRGVLSRARTESERQAAQKLLDDAIKDQEAAAEALADFQEDQHLAQLAAEKDALDASLQQRRDAAQRAHDDAKDAAEKDAEAQRKHWQDWADAERTAAQVLYDQRRAAAEREFVAKQAEAERELGDLQEQLRAGEITHKEFLARLANVYNDPTIKQSLLDSGQTLGLSFSRGLDRSKEQVEKSAKSLAAIVKKYLKLNSPAEAGPLKYDPEAPGRIIGASLAAGMASQRRTVEDMARQLAAAAVLQPTVADVLGRGGVTPSAWATAGATTTYNQQRTINQNVSVTARGQEDALALARRLEWAANTAGGRY